MGLTSVPLFNGQYLRETKARMQGLQAGDVEQFSMAYIGDSWTNGRVSYWIGRLNTILKANFSAGGYGNGAPGWCGFAYPSSGQAFVNGNIDPGQIANPIFGGSWISNYVSGLGPDIGNVVSSSAGDTINTQCLTSAITGLDLFYEGGTGVIEYSFDNVHWTSLALSGSGLQIVPLIGFPATSFITYLRVVSGTCTLDGLDFKKAGNGIVLHRLGTSGSYAENYAVLNAASWQAGIASLNPRFTQILLGTNDQLQYTASAFTGYVQTMIDNVRAAAPDSDLLLVTPPENSGGRPNPMTSYARAARGLAYSNRCAHLDLQPIFGDSITEYGFGTTRGWIDSSLLHPSIPGGRLITEEFRRVLTCSY